MESWTAKSRRRKQLTVILASLLIVTAHPEAVASLPPVPRRSKPLDQEVASAALCQLIEQDWLQQARAIAARAVGPIGTSTDARGACDGVKNGKYGFHTGLEPNPWWQVDLGAVMPISRLVVFNRLDYKPGLHNADNLHVLASTDGQHWITIHENRGTHFGGITGAKRLDIRFEESELRARFVRLQLPSTTPIYFHLDEVEIYGPGPDATNLALHCPADQSSLSQWSTAKPLGATATRVYPTARFIQVGYRLAADLQQYGLNCQPYLCELDELSSRLEALPSGAAEEVGRELYLQTRWSLRRLVFANPLLDFERLLFVKRFTQETYPDVCLNHMPWVSRPGGDICMLSSAAGDNPTRAGPFRTDRRGSLNPQQSTPNLFCAANVRHVLNGALGPGHVHGIDLWWDADRVVFGYARTRSNQPPDGWLDRSQSYRLRRTEEPIHLFEVATDGRKLRQLTFGQWSDLDPTYAPNGDIVFVSERCATSLQCNEYDKDETSCNLYVIKPNGNGIRRLSANKDGDYLPHTLDDGSIAYTRWEYHERSWAYIQSIWTIRPDGTGADAIFKQHFVNPWALEDTRSIPGSKKLVSIAAGHHTLAVGPVVVIDPAVGINNPQGISIVTPDVKPPEGGMDGVPVVEGGVHDGGGLYTTPWALSDKCFLAAYTYSNQQTDATGYGLYFIDVFGNKELIYRDPSISCFTPIPLRVRPRPPILPETVDLKQQYAVCTVTDASFGTDGIQAERVGFIRISEPIGWPYDNAAGGQRYGEDHGYGGPGAERKNLLNWTPMRILGNVPIEPDGSAHFKVPADTAVYFQLLDENRMELRRMRSFISFQPGESRSCVGCHESRGTAPPVSAEPSRGRPGGTPNRTSLAAKRGPRPPIPPPWGNRPVSFLRDVQPVLDRHCVSCHSGLKPAGNLDFSGGLITYDPSIPGYGHNRAYETIMQKALVAVSQVRAQDATITPPLAYGSHKSKLIQTLSVTPHPEHVQLTEEDRLRLVMWIDANAPYHDGFVNKRLREPAYDLASDEQLLASLQKVHQRRCSACHDADEVSRLDWVDIWRPGQSLFLSAALQGSKETRRCRKAVYDDRNDPDYVLLHSLLTAAVQKAWKHPRRELAPLNLRIVRCDTWRDSDAVPKDACDLAEEIGQEGILARLNEAAESFPAQE